MIFPVGMRQRKKGLLFCVITVRCIFIEEIVIASWKRNGAGPDDIRVWLLTKT